MSGYHNNLLSYCLDGAGAVYLLGLGLAVSLALGSFVGVMIVAGSAHHLTVISAIFWIGGVLFGLAQVWGFLSYILISLEVIALFRVESQRWLILLTIMLVQTCETARMLLDAQDRSPWLQAAAVSGVLIFPILGLAAYRYLDRTPATDDAPYTDCRACGYNLTGTLAASRTSCPECGEAITQYQQVKSMVDQRKLGGQSTR